MLITTQHNTCPMCHVMWDWMVSTVGDQWADRKEGCLHVRLPVLLCDSVSVLVLLFSFSLHSSLPPRLPTYFSLTYFFIYFISSGGPSVQTLVSRLLTSCLLQESYVLHLAPPCFFVIANSSWIRSILLTCQQGNYKATSSLASF